MQKTLFSAMVTMIMAASFVGGKQSESGARSEAQPYSAGAARIEAMYQRGESYDRIADQTAAQSTGQESLGDTMFRAWLRVEQQRIHDVGHSVAQLALIDAVRNNHVPRALDALAQGADPDIPLYPGTRLYHRGRYLLHIAVDAGFYTMVQILLNNESKKANVNARDSFGRTTLDIVHEAVGRSRNAAVYNDIYQFLHRRGALFASHCDDSDGIAIEDHGARA